jgi:uncharacterized membrane protein
MLPDNRDDVLFSATLTPHRSLGRRGFLVLMSVIAGLWFFTGLYFWSLGAGLVMGFIGLDFLAIWLAFKLNYRAARAYEDLEVTPDALVIRKISAGGRIQEIRFNPRWARLELHREEEEGITRVTVRMRDERVVVGGFLNPDDRQSFARAFGAALAEARR